MSGAGDAGVVGADKHFTGMLDVVGRLILLKFLFDKFNEILLDIKLILTGGHNKISLFDGISFNFIVVVEGAAGGFDDADTDTGIRSWFDWCFGLESSLF